MAIIKRVMGIDPSTKSGVVLLDSNEGHLRPLEFCEVNFPKAKGLERVQLIGQKIGELIQSWQPQLVITEGYAFGNRHTLVTMAEIGTSIRLQVLEQGVPLLVVAPNALKKFVTGKGNAKKDAMMLACYKQWGFEGTDNECDAFGLAALGIYARNPEVKPRLGAIQRQLMQEWKAEHLSIFLDKPEPI